MKDITIVVDTSALMAVLLEESDGPAMLRRLSQSPKVLVSSATYLECCLVVGGRKGKQEVAGVAELLEEIGAEIVSFTPEQAQVAQEAWLQYGKGNHKAKLNFGDCFSYALSKVSGQPLLFKGRDFALTDVKRA